MPFTLTTLRLIICVYDLHSVLPHYISCDTSCFSHKDQCNHAIELFHQETQKDNHLIMTTD